MAQKYPAIPDPFSNTSDAGLRATASALKEGQEILTGQRGDRTLAAVSWQDLLRLGLITAAQLPRTPNSGA